MSEKAQHMPPEHVVKGGRINPEVRKNLIDVSDAEFEQKAAEAGEFTPVDRFTTEDFDAAKLQQIRESRGWYEDDAADMAEDAAMDLELDEGAEEELKLMYFKLKMDSEIRGMLPKDRDTDLDDLVIGRAHDLMRLSDADFKDLLERWRTDDTISYARQYRQAHDEAKAEDRRRTAEFNAAYAAATSEDEAHNQRREQDLHSGDLTFEQFKEKYPYLAYKYSNRADSPYGRPADARPEQQWTTDPGATLDRVGPGNVRYHWEVVSVDGGNVVARLTRAFPNGAVYVDAPARVGNSEKFLHDINHPDQIENNDWTIQIPANEQAQEGGERERGRDIRGRLRRMVMGSVAMRLVTQIRNELSGRGGDVFLNQPAPTPTPPRHQQAPAPAQAPTQPAGNPEAQQPAPAAPESNGGNNPWDQLGITEQVWARNEHVFYEQFKDDFQSDENGDVHPTRPVENMTPAAKAYIDRLRQGGR